MAKNIRRMLAMVLVMCMFASALPMQALAAEGETITQGELTITITPSESSPGTSDVTVSGENPSGESVLLNGSSTTSSSTTTDSQGNETTVNTTEVSVSGTEGDKTVTECTQTTVESSTKDADGNEIHSSVVVDGYGKKEWSVEEDTKGDPSVEVELKPGEETSAEVIVEGSEKTETSTENGTVITDSSYEVDRTVKAETSEIEVTVNDTKGGLVDRTSPAPVYDVINGVKEDKGGVFDNQFNSGANSKYANPSNWNMPEEGDLRFVGTGEHSYYYTGFMTVVYEKDENGNTVYDEEGNPVIAKLLDSAGGNITIDGKPATELLSAHEYDGYSGSRPFMFMLMDENKNKYYAYCCDLQTGAGEGKYYTITNLEDSNYYASEESEAHIRSIAMNGYWGTSDIAKENGSYEMGSLESIKTKLKAAIANGEISATVLVPERNVNANGNVVLGEDGQPIYKEMNILDYLDGLTAGEALLATQSAIWTYANGSTNVANGKDGAIVVSPDWYRNHQIGFSKTYGEHLDDAGGARVELLYQWLINLETEEKSTIVINDKNFVEDMGITVHDKVDGHKNNDDDNQDNDVYNTDLNFKLAFIPGANDDLLVQITYNDLDGTPVTVVRRLAGENAEGQSFETIKPETDGSYILRGLQLSENKDFNFDLRLEGTQYLENGVYVYQAVGGRDVSQTFVGVAEGTRNVDISAGVTIRFDVDEDNRVVAERTWHNEYDPNYTPPTPHTPALTNLEPEAAPQVFRLANQNVEEIPEEPVPLAAPVITGDNSGLWIAVVLLSVFAMAAINLFDKKRQQETF